MPVSCMLGIDIGIRFGTGSGSGTGIDIDVDVDVDIGRNRLGLVFPTLELTEDRPMTYLVGR